MKTYILQLKPFHDPIRKILAEMRRNALTKEITHHFKAEYLFKRLIKWVVNREVIKYYNSKNITFFNNDYEELKSEIISVSTKSFIATNKLSMNEVEDLLDDGDLSRYVESLLDAIIETIDKNSSLPLNFRPNLVMRPDYLDCHINPNVVTEIEPTPNLLIVTVEDSRILLWNEGIVITEEALEEESIDKELPIICS